MSDDFLITLYGIPNCDQVRKARAWLDAHSIPYSFHDFKKSGIDPRTIAAWQAELGWESLLNRKGLTWRGLPEDQRARAHDAASAAGLMREFPSLIKRPILRTGSGCIAGFSDVAYENAFKG